MRKIQFITNNIYHIYNRGVEKRAIFLDDNDHFRFIHDLFEFNDIAYAGKFSHGILSGTKFPIYKKRELIVEILVFTLMNNHFHLLLKQKVDNGISNFMHKLGVGYTNYFNEKNNRVGSLFQGTFKAVELSNDVHFKYLPHYIHLNPIKIIGNLVPESKNELEILKKYRWSSYLDYIGIKNFPSILSLELRNNLWGTAKKYKNDLKNCYNALPISNLHKIIIEKD